MEQTAPWWFKDIYAALLSLSVKMRCYNRRSAAKGWRVTAAEVWPEVRESNTLLDILSEYLQDELRLSLYGNNDCVDSLTAVDMGRAVERLTLRSPASTQEEVVEKKRVMFDKIVSMRNFCAESAGAEDMAKRTEESEILAHDKYSTMEITKLSLQQRKDFLRQKQAALWKSLGNSNGNAKQVAANSDTSGGDNEDRFVCDASDR